MKLASFEYDESAGRWREVKGVNITLGLPIIRTSVDHAPTFDQAGKGTASPERLTSTITYAICFSQSRHPEV